MKKEAMQMKAFGLYCDAKDTVTAVCSKKSIMVMLMTAICICNIMPVFAAGLFDELSTQLTNAYNSFIPIVNISAAAKRWLIRVAVGWLIVSVFPFILIKSREMLGSTATGTGADQLKSIKPGA